MGFWAGIKYALNSTLGTADFVPLDKLINDKIDSVRTLGASDAIIIFVGSGTTSNKERKIMLSFRSHVNGSMRCMGTVKAGTTSYSSSGGLAIYNGDTRINYKYGSESDTVDVSFDFAIEKDKIYDVCITTGDYQRTEVSDVRLGASVIDASLITVV